MVGVIANLSLWFATHVFFREISAVNLGPLRTILPDLGTLQILPVAIAALAAILLLVRHWGIVWVLVICSGSSLLVLTLGLPL